MTHITEAIYANGVLKPLNALGLREQQHVRLIVQPINGTAAADRTEAIERLRAGIEHMNFHLDGNPPSRDDLHDRS